MLVLACHRPGLVACARGRSAVATEPHNLDGCRTRSSGTTSRPRCDVKGSVPCDLDENGARPPPPRNDAGGLTRNTARTAPRTGDRRPRRPSGTGHLEAAISRLNQGFHLLPSDEGAGKAAPARAPRLSYQRVRSVPVDGRRLRHGQDRARGVLPGQRPPAIGERLLQHVVEPDPEVVIALGESEAVGLHRGRFANNREALGVLSDIARPRSRCRWSPHRPGRSATGPGRLCPLRTSSAPGRCRAVHGTHRLARKIIGSVDRVVADPHHEGLPGLEVRLIGLRRLIVGPPAWRPR